MLADDTAGDPITGIRWTRKSIRALAARLNRQYRVGRSSVRRLLRARHFRLLSNRKRLSRQQDPQRDRQFRYIARQRRAFEKAGWPIISVDTKKKN